MGDLHVMVEAETRPQRAGAGAVVLEVAAEDLGRGVGVGAVAKRRSVHPGANHRRGDPGQRGRSHRPLGHRPVRTEVGLEVAGAAVDADNPEGQLRVVNGEGKRDGGTPAVADDDDRLRMMQPASNPSRSAETVSKS